MSGMMKRYIGFIVLLFLCPLVASGRTDSSGSCRLRVSLLTVGVGDEIYASFGHTGIRITDTAAETDIVYNWGTFDGYQDNFELNFARGKLLYYCSSEPYQHFIQTYIYEKRGVEEQEIFLNDLQKRELQAFINENLKEENRYYKYDFLYDNCATRPRDVFPKTFGSAFRYGQAIPTDKKVTFRDEIDRYLAHLPWERFGIDLLLGSPVDKVMSNEDAMFLPDYLKRGITSATVNGQRVSQQPVRVLPDGPAERIPANTPFFLMLAFGAMVIVGSAIPGFKPLSALAGHLLLIVTGLLGCLMVFMWLGTDHQSCRNNFNVLWCLPTNIIIPFIKREKRSRYALVAMALIVVSIMLHLLKIQALPMGIIWPLLLALMAFFGMIYRSAIAPESDEPDTHQHH
jgi:hypothetical protein